MKLHFIHFIHLIALILLLSPLISPAQETRSWTTLDGITHQGSLMFMSRQNVTLQGPAGTITLPLAKLSDADLVYISKIRSKNKGLQNPGIPMNNLPPGFSKNRNHATPAKPNTTPKTQTLRPAKSLPAPTAKWPSKVKTSFSSADIKTISETKREGYIYRSPHFEFHSPFRLPHRAIREFSLIFEATYDLAKAMPIGLDPQPGGNGYYITELFETKEDYFAAGGPIGSAGAFYPFSGKILVPLPSLGVVRTQNNVKITRGAASDTLIHEVTHQVMMRWLPLIPIWMGEGFAEITSAQPYESGLFNLSRMSKAVRVSTGRGPGAGRAFEMIPLQELMNISSQSWSAAVSAGEGLQNYHSASLLTYYFLRLDGDGQGKRLNNFINAKLKGGGLGNTEEQYLLDGRSYEELQKDVAKAWREEGLRISYRR